MTLRRPPGRVARSPTDEVFSLPTMRRTATLVLLASLAGLALSTAQATESATRIDGVNFEPRLQLAGQTLQLNGIGLRSVAWLKGYAAGLYLGHRALSADRVLAMPGAKRLSMRMLLDVPVAEFVKAFHKGIERNTLAVQQPPLLERMALFDQLIQPLGTLRKGDSVDLDFVPERGLVVSHNARVIGAPIAGDDFYAALLGIFIGPKPVDDKLKAGLLGGATS